MEFNTFDSKPLRILIDTRMLLGSFSGVARVVTGLIHELTLLDNVQVIALCGNESYEPFEKNKNIEVVTTSFSREMRTAARRVWWEESQLPGILREVQPHVYHATWNTGIPKRCSVPAILTIHDLIPSQNPRIHFYTRTQQWAYEYSLSASAKRASAITTVSNYSRKEVLDYLHIDPQRVFTVWNGVEQSPATETETPSFVPAFRTICRRASIAQEYCRSAADHANLLETLRFYITASVNRQRRLIGINSTRCLQRVTG